jgi:hypothetical protein
MEMEYSLPSSRSTGGHGSRTQLSFPFHYNSVTNVFEFERDLQLDGIQPNYHYRKSSQAERTTMLRPRLPPNLHDRLDMHETHKPAASADSIFVISQCAWRVKQAFTSGRKSTDIPLATGFLEVEDTLDELDRLLKELSKCFGCEGVDSFLSGIELEAQNGIRTILMACKHTLRCLEVLVNSLQTKRKADLEAGHSMQRLWQDVVLTGQDTLPWTANGGCLQDLQDILKMHATIVTMLESVTTRWVLQRCYRRKHTLLTNG